MSAGVESTIDTGRLIEGRYRVESRLATGATSEVFVGRDETLGRRVAIKVLQGETGDRRRFATEVRLLATLDHPGLVRLYDAVDEASLAVLIMEFVDGPSLAQQLTNGSLSDSQVRRLGTELASCLAYLHQLGVVHRDIKPANVLLGGDGRARLADFGIARLVDATRLTQTGQTVGTLAYMAPEQLTGDAVGPPADIYALGLVLLEALSGRRAFAGAGHEAVAARLGRDPDIPPELSDVWRSLLGDMTGRQPEQRPTAIDVSRRLGSGPAVDHTEVILESPPAVAPTMAFMAAATHRLAASAPSRRVLAVLAAAIALLLVVLLIASRSGAHRTGPQQVPSTSTPSPTSPQPAPTAPASTTQASSMPTTVVGSGCASLEAQRQALDAQRRSIDQNKALTSQQRDAARKRLGTEQRALDQAQKDCGPPPH